MINSNDVRAIPLCSFSYTKYGFKMFSLKRRQSVEIKSDVKMCSNFKSGKESYVIIETNKQTIQERKNGKLL